MQQLVEYILNPGQQESVERLLEFQSSRIRQLPAHGPMPAVTPEMAILGQLSEIIQIVRHWVETQKELIAQVKTLEGKTYILTVRSSILNETMDLVLQQVPTPATTQQPTNQAPTKKQQKQN